MEELRAVNRRKFLKQAGTLLAAGSLAVGSWPRSAWADQANYTRVTILHTNDVHSRIDPFPMDGSRNQGLGGAARRAVLIKKLRKEEKNVLLFDAGDAVQGTPYFNLFGGDVEIDLMNKMGYDAATLGNHEFDNGIKGFMDQLPHADFSFVNSNYDFSGSPMRNDVKPYKIIKKSGIKVGIFGLGIELQGLVAAKHFGSIRYQDPVAVAKEMVEELQAQKCDLIICLSHIGYSYKSQKIDDLKLAAQLDGIDLIIGGHTHTFLDHPTEVFGPGGQMTLVNQVGWSGIKLGRVDFEFSRSNSLNQVRANSIAIK